jgi:hypothetical protein
MSDAERKKKLERAKRRRQLERRHDPKAFVQEITEVCKRYGVGYGIMFCDFRLGWLTIDCGPDDDGRHGLTQFLRDYLQPIFSYPAHALPGGPWTPEEAKHVMKTVAESLQRLSPEQALKRLVSISKNHAQENGGRPSWTQV